MSLSDHSLPICSDYPLKVLFLTLASINADCGEYNCYRRNNYLSYKITIGTCIRSMI